MKRGLFVVTALVLMAGVIASAAASSEDANPASVKPAEVRAAFEVIVAHQPRDLCPTFADDVSMCAASLEWVGDVRPTSATLESITPLADGSSIATVSGRAVEAGVHSTYESFIQFVRATDGSVTAVDPIYWMPRVLAKSGLSSPTPTSSRP